MAQQTINNGDAGLDARTKINTNFLELYTGKIGTATAGTNITWTVNSNGISINNPAWLTTARASNDAIGLNTAQTNVTWTINSSGLSLNAGGYAGTGTSATNASITLNSNGLAISVAAPGGGGLTNINVSAGTTSNLLSAITFSNLNGISFGLNASTVTASHNGLTTARASNDGIGLNTAQTNVTWTVNSSGISFNAGGYAGTGTTFNGANISGSITQNSNGINLSMSVAAPGGGGAINVSAGTTSNNLQTVVFSNSNGVSFGLNGSTVTASVSGGGKTYTGFEPFPGAISVAGQYGAGTLYIVPFAAPAFQADRVCVPIHISNASNSSNSATISMSIGIYTRTGNSLSLYTSQSASYNFTASGTVGSYSQFAGIRLVTFPITNTYEANNYYFGLWSRTATGGGAGMTFSNLLVSNLNSSYSGLLGVGTNNSMVYMVGKGISSVSFTTAMPNEVPLVNIIGNSSLFQRPPMFYFASSTL
jgi:hypothetical protein